MKPKGKQQPSAATMKKAGDIAATIHNVKLLRLHSKSNKYRVPSSKGPHIKYIVLNSPSGRRDRCDCKAHEKGRRPCKHVLALKIALGA
jgi:predicted nucleic acid-binding Zn finger protein